MTTLRKGVLLGVVVANIGGLPYPLRVRRALEGRASETGGDCRFPEPFFHGLTGSGPVRRLVEDR